MAAAPSSRPDVARASGRDLLLPDERVYTDFRAMAEAEAGRPDGIDAVAIVTPNATHHAIARAFMDQGIDVISDKPVTSTLADALDLVAEQRRTGLVFGVTYSFAGHAMVRQARQMVAEGALGRLRRSTSNISRNGRFSPRPRAARVRPGGSTRPRSARPLRRAISARTPITSRAS